MDGTLGSATFASLGKAWDHFSHCRVRDIGISWDVGPFAARLQCLHLDTPLLKQLNINTKKLDETKNNCVHVQLEQMLDPKDTETKKTKTQLPLLRSLEQKQGVRSKGRVLLVPLHSRHLRGNKPPTPLLRSDSRHNPTLTPYKERAHPPQDSASKACCLFSHSPAAAGTPIKPYLNFYCPASLSTSIDGRRPRTLVSISIGHSTDKARREFQREQHENKCPSSK